MSRDLIGDILEASKILRSMPILKEGRCVWMSKQTFLDLGGTNEAWYQISGDDGVKLLFGDK